MIRLEKHLDLHVIRNVMRLRDERESEQPNSRHGRILYDTSAASHGIHGSCAPARRSRIMERSWRYRLTVRTEPSQGLNTGSIPVSATNLTVLFSSYYHLNNGFRANICKQAP